MTARKGGAKNRGSSLRKTAAKTAATQQPVLVEQPHGGALLTGGLAGNAGGTGRPSHEIRQQLRGSFSDRVRILEEMADGAIDVPLNERCEHCGKRPTQQPSHADLIRLVTSAADRRAALETMAKYGLGTVKELSTEFVQQKLRDTADFLRQHIGPENYDRLVPGLRAIWSAR